MAWTNPTTAVAGSVLAASLWNSDVRDNSLMGNPVFTNEAARDAVITAPVEGQRAYLTAPTVPAASGGTTVVPSGVQTIYNGTAWVCVTEVGAFTANVGQLTSTSYTTTLTPTPGTNPSVTLVTGTTAIVHISCTVYYITTAATGYVAVAVSGATTQAANDDLALVHTAVNGIAMTRTIILTGLTAGTNTFTLNYRTTGSTFVAEDRFLIVKGIA